MWVGDEDDDNRPANIKIPAKLLEASAARRLKIKKMQDDREKTMAEAEFPDSCEDPNLNKTPQDLSAKKEKPIAVKRVPKYQDPPAPKQQATRSFSNENLKAATGKSSPAPQKKKVNTSPSKTALEIERIRKQRDERRTEQANVRKRTEGMTSEEIYAKTFERLIKSFRKEHGYNIAAKPIGVNNIQIQDEVPRIRVCIRRRPTSEKEQERIDVVTCRTESYPNAVIYVHEPKKKLDLSQDMEHHSFVFDNVFDEASDNELIYCQTLKSLIPLLELNGRVNFFAFGQTSSGKTHTVFGSPSGGVPGVFHYACRDIFSLVAESHPDWQLGASFYEIYGGRVYDLFQMRQRCELLEDAKGDVVVHGLEELIVQRPEDLIELVRIGFDSRSTAATSANDESSRSHAIFQIVLRNTLDEVQGKFSLIDLAGSERAADVNHTDKLRRIEGAEINKSLLALKECIRALHKRQLGQHIPFRASKLTQVLKDSLIGDNSCTVMVATVCPTADACDHTLNTLRYANRVKEFKGNRMDRAESSLKIQVGPQLVALGDSMKSPENEDLERMHAELESPKELVDLHKAANALCLEHELLSQSHQRTILDCQLIDQQEQILLSLDDMEIYVQGLEQCLVNKMELLGDLMRLAKTFKQHLNQIELPGSIE